MKLQKTNVVDQKKFNADFEKNDLANKRTN
jgi:hypothetical protein